MRIRYRTFDSDPRIRNDVDPNSALYMIRKSSKKWFTIAKYCFCNKIYNILFAKPFFYMQIRRKGIRSFIRIWINCCGSGSPTLLPIIVMCWCRACHGTSCCRPSASPCSTLWPASATASSTLSHSTSSGRQEA